MSIFFLFFLPVTSLLFSAICKASSDNHFALLHFFFLGMVLITASYTVLQTSIHSSSDTLSDLILWIYLSLPLYNQKGFDLGHIKWFSGFPYFFQFKSEFCNSHSQLLVLFCWLYIASSIFDCKEYNKSDIIIDHLVMWIIFCVTRRGYLLWPVHMLAFVLLLFVLQDQTCSLLQVSFDFLLLHSSLLWWKGHFFFILVL